MTITVLFDNYLTHDKSYFKHHLKIIKFNVKALHTRLREDLFLPFWSFLVFSLLYFLSFLIKHILIHRFIFVLPFWSFLVFSLLFSPHSIMYYHINAFSEYYIKTRGVWPQEDHETCVLFQVVKITDTGQFFPHSINDILIFWYNNQNLQVVSRSRRQYSDKNTWSETIKWQKIARFPSEPIK